MWEKLEPNSDTHEDFEELIISQISHFFGKRYVKRKGMAQLCLYLANFFDENEEPESFVFTLQINPDEPQKWYSLSTKLKQLTSDEDAIEFMKLHENMRGYIHRHQQRELDTIWLTTKFDGPKQLSQYIQQLNTEPIRIRKVIDEEELRKQAERNLNRY